VPSPTPSICNEEDLVSVNCDFSTLTAGLFVDLANLQQSCGFTVNTPEGTLSIFDTSKLRGQGQQFDSDLGSPNRDCGGPGVGAGGKPGAAYPNCEAQGNALIIQDPAVTDRPNDNVSGGCIVFEFRGEIELINMKMLDVEVRSNSKICWTVDNCEPIFPKLTLCVSFRNTGAKRHH
jgi:hypothetical protein